ncbi:MAG: DEAD/DEAH box helicase family protein [Desulfobacterales bacterium]|uniref:DEAD/DEAH box helicase family protein n=1 Tax=Candidatus Desulfatibia profunda TaxID=2841695 RepID=A0A8J6TK88_9BACT|nr:DEAD/DEAH box helicase family protein [Candidatus Desulfatibia profunda]MBL7179936.1 DEAD/DEAH box helicase family protein [Desulfobacterales bacterium]
MKSTIDRLIINSPYEEPKQYWSYDRETRLFTLMDGRRPAGYVVASQSSKAFDDPGMFIEIPLVNQIRSRLDAWRKAEYPGVTGITKRLLEHWQNPEEREYRIFFFCQMEAIETLIWLAEAPDDQKVGIEIPTDGGPFKRLCSKMATGSGKTIVMAMLIAWQVLNKITYPQDARFSKYVFIVAPGLTVKSRLNVLYPWAADNYYDEFNVVPVGLKERLRQGKFLIRNWHALQWATEEQLTRKKSVDKRGAKSNEAYVREVLGKMANATNILVINDEAHHAWRVPAESKVKGVKKAELEEATIWVSGLDRIHETRNILVCHDFSATPFAPSGKKSSEEALFGWIVSDFGLNDAIESGLVKTPRVVIRDDGKLTKDYKSRLYHIYNDAEVKDDINRKAKAHEPLPDLITSGYYLLGKDWLETAKAWEKAGFKTPPVMISVANRTETAARVKYAFDHKKVRIDELCIPERILHIDSRVLELAEAQEEAAPVSDAAGEDDFENETVRKLSKKELAEALRQTVDSVGQTGKPGALIQKVISVGMLSEGWDAKTVTHIMGLRAFSSQLLCEQVVGRGLRRTSYEVNPETNLFEAEYVNIFGVPFTFLPHESKDGPPPPPPTPKTRIEPVVEKQQFEISWPNIIRVEHTYKPVLTLDMGNVPLLALSAYNTATLAELAPIVEGKPDVTQISRIDLEDLGRKFRMQKIIFETARDIFDQMKPNWKGNREFLLAQLIRLVESFIRSDRIQIEPLLFYQDGVKRRILLTLNMNKVVQHIWEAIRFENSESIEPIFDQDYPIRSTADMQTWFTGRPCEHTRKSHINMCVFDSTWEASEAFELDRNPHVKAWVKNDHLGFEILYIFEGIVRKYRPDFIIQLKTDNFLILETKGKDTLRDKTKRRFLNEWVQAVNQHGGFGNWKWAVSGNPADVKMIIEDAVLI